MSARRFVVASVFTGSTLGAANGANSLEELAASVSDGDVAYCLGNNRFYAWSVGSSATPNGDLVVKRRHYPNATVGRWLVSGPPGSGRIPAGSYMLFAGGDTIVYEVATATAGGSPTELVIPSVTLDGVLWGVGSYADVMVGTSNPNIQARGNIPGQNALEISIVDISGANIPAGLLVSIKVRRDT